MFLFRWNRKYTGGFETKIGRKTMTVVGAGAGQGARSLQVDQGILGALAQEGIVGVNAQ